MKIVKTLRKMAWESTMRIEQKMVDYLNYVPYDNWSPDVYSGTIGEIERSFMRTTQYKLLELSRRFYYLLYVLFGGSKNIVDNPTRNKRSEEPFYIRKILA